jgi:hypothetical protein
MDLADTAAVIANARSLLEQCRPAVDSVSQLQWTFKTGFWTILLRCVLRRQYDALETIIGLAQGRSHSASPLLRPACEEYLWLKFLRTIAPNTREAIILAKSSMDAAQTVEAQVSYVQDKTLQRFGFRPEFVERMRHRRADAEANMKVIGKQLNWNLRADQYFPSVARIARLVDEEQLYSILYHATSRTVHFNVAELFRRAWGTSEKVVIGSQQMNEYWLRFTLYWGLGLFALTLLEVSEEFEANSWPMSDVADQTTFDNLIQEWGEAGKFPIITPEEMNQHLQPGERPFS